MLLISEYEYNECKIFLDKYYLGNINKKKDIILIAEEENEKIGYIILEVKCQLAEIKELFVLEKFRNMKLGEGLLRSSLNLLRLRNINKVVYKYDCNYLINKGFIVKKNFLECNIEDFFLKNNCKR
ncbi:GNAT family N-acetyltransferase [Clostridium sp. D2Q-14]|uniref:GNAT family N-acetyltransferase n=1 Tax=Anaeromonas gelatinilytica TaxID=2683194 RepID=UPI00193C58E7|nr:GNAT family N-acetyltransferase [Anaeromonas gelatinilytica]MBS4536242.1 GNAT family N-acetyltransferase [Anaeromonas gelatinilytica]